MANKRCNGSSEGATRHGNHHSVAKSDHDVAFVVNLLLEQAPFQEVLGRGSGENGETKSADLFRQRTARKKLAGRVAQTGGVISVGEVRAKASKCEEDEFAKVTMVYERAVAAEQKKEQAGLNAEKKVCKGLFSEARWFIAVRKKLEVGRRKKARVVKKSIACRKQMAV